MGKPGLRIYLNEFTEEEDRKPQPTKRPLTLSEKLKILLGNTVFDDRPDNLT